MSRHCQCAACAGEAAPTYSQAYLRACEARFVRALSPARRSRYFDAVERRRGLDGLVVLKRELAILPDHRGRW